MNRIYVAGHKNPDMDCTCAAYCYAAYKRIVDPANEYIPIRTGPLSAQIRDVFQLAEVAIPRHLESIAPTVGMVARPSPVALAPDDPVLEAFRAVETETISALPVFAVGGELVGVVGVNEITRYAIAQNQLSRPVYTFFVDNFDRVLPGRLVQAGGRDRFKAPVMTGSMPDEQAISYTLGIEPQPLLVVGNRPAIITAAVKADLPAIVITGVSDLSELEADLRGYRGAVFLSSTDTAETIRLLRLSSPVSTIMDTDVPRLSADTLFDRAKGDLINSRFRGLPIFDGDEFVGMVSRRSFIERPRNKLIMVDHNELSQAIDGAEEAEILEIVDHHRLSPPSTLHPIAVTTRVVGSTCTLVYEEFANNGLALDRSVAILLLSGIVSDTVNLHSPTTTDADRRALYRLESVTGISATEHATNLFAQLRALESREPREIILSDFKRYRHAGVEFGIGQVEVTTLGDSEGYRPRILEALGSVAREQNLTWALLMVTDVIKRNSMLLSSSYPDGEAELPFSHRDEHTFDLPGVLSRKKQLLPEVMRVLSGDD